MIRKEVPSNFKITYGLLKEKIAETQACRVKKKKIRSYALLKCLANKSCCKLPTFT